MKLIKLLFVFLLFLTPSIYSINLQITGEIKEYQTDYYEQVKVELVCGEELQFKTPNNAKNILLNNISTQETSFLLTNCESINTINYVLEDNLEKIDSDNFRIERNFNSYDIENYTYTFIIPLEYVVDKVISIPNNYEISHTDTKKILNFQANEIYVLYINKVDLEEHSFSLLSITEEFSEGVVILVAIFSFLIGCFVVYFYMVFKMKNLPQMSIPSFVLDKEEKDVLEVIKENQGINQKQIAGKLNYSKSKVSAIVNNLEQKKLVRREKFGRSFKVYMNKKIV